MIGLILIIIGAIISFIGIISLAYMMFISENPDVMDTFLNYFPVGGVIIMFIGAMSLI